MPPWVHAAAATVLYLGAVALFGLKFWSSIRGMELQQRGTLWTTRDGWRIYVLSKITPTMAGLCVLGATALLNVPAFVLWGVAVWVALIATITLLAIRTHLPRIRAAQRTRR